MYERDWQRSRTRVGMHRRKAQSCDAAVVAPSGPQARHCSKTWRVMGVSEMECDCVG